MKLIKQVSFCLIFLLFATVCWGVDLGPEKASAQESGLQWLAMVDDGEYGASWEAASKPFKEKVSKNQWQQALMGLRTPLGKVQKRSLMSASFHTALPGAPEGEYVVLQYKTIFENKHFIETVTPMLDSDGTWRVSGYFIKGQE